MTRPQYIKMKNTVLWPGHLLQKFWSHQHQGGPWAPKITKFCSKVNVMIKINLAIKNRRHWKKSWISWAMKCPGKFTFFVYFLHQESLTFPWLFLVQYRAEFQAHFLNQGTWNFRHISCSQDTWHLKHISSTFHVGTFWHKWKYLKAGCDISCTFPTHRKFGVLGTFPEHRKGGYHLVWEPIRRWHFLHLSCNWLIP